MSKTGPLQTHTQPHSGTRTWVHAYFTDLFFSFFCLVAYLFLLLLLLYYFFYAYAQQRVCKRCMAGKRQKGQALGPLLAAGKLVKSNICLATNLFSFVFVFIFAFVWNSRDLPTYLPQQAHGLKWCWRFVAIKKTKQPKKRKNKNKKTTNCNMQRLTMALVHTSER